MIAPGSTKMRSSHGLGRKGLKTIHETIRILGLICRSPMRIITMKWDSTCQSRWPTFSQSNIDLTMRGAGSILFLTRQRRTQLQGGNGIGAFYHSNMQISLWPLNNCSRHWRTLKARSEEHTSELQS